MLYDATIIIGLHGNLFSMMQSLKKIFQVVSQSTALIMEKNLTKICFDKEMANNGSDLFKN